MGLKFQCPNCGAEIVVKHLKVGEQALCRNCNIRSRVPETATEVQEPVIPEPEKDVPETVGWQLFQSPVQEVLPEEPQINIGNSAWNPRRFKWIGFFFGPVPCLALAAFNWEKLGYLEKKKRLLIIAGGSLVLWLLFGFALLDSSYLHSVAILITLFNVSLGEYLASSQMPVYTKFLRAGGQDQSFGLPVLNSIVFSIAVMALLAGAFLLRVDRPNQAQWDRAVQELSEGRYAAASGDFAAVREYYDDEPALWYNLGVAHLNLNHFDSAYQALTAGYALDTGDVDFKILLTYLIDELQWHPYSGEVRTWYRSGTKKMECYYAGGQIQGKCIEYWSDGTHRRLMHFRDGTPDGQFQLWNRDGTKFAEGMLVRGRLNGAVLCWHPETTAPETTAVYETGMLVRGTPMESLFQ